MVLKIVTLVFIPPLAAAMITIMLMNPEGENTKMLGLMIILVILTIAMKGFDLMRAERLLERMEDYNAGRIKTMKVPKPRVASDAGRSIALGVALSMMIGLMSAGLISPKLYYTMDLISFVLMVLTVLSLSTLVWYGAFPKPKRPKPIPIPEVAAIAGAAKAELPGAAVAGAVAPGAVAAGAVVAGAVVAGATVPGATPAVAATGTALVAAPGQATALAGPEVTIEPEEMMVEMVEGESLEEIKKRLKPAKPKIDLSLLASGNSYDDKVALLRFLVSEDQQRVSKALRGMMSPR